MVSGTYGIGPRSTWWALDSWAMRVHRGCRPIAKSKSKISGVLPSLCPFRVARTCWRIGSSSTQTALTCCWSRTSLREHRRKMTEAESANFLESKSSTSLAAIIPAVTHVDYSARIQTVHKETNPRYHDFIQRFKKRTGCPVMLIRVSMSGASPSWAHRRMHCAAFSVLNWTSLFAVMHSSGRIDRRPAKR